MPEFDTVDGVSHVDNRNVENNDIKTKKLKIWILDHLSGIL